MSKYFVSIEATDSASKQNRIATKLFNVLIQTGKSLYAVKALIEKLCICREDIHLKKKNVE